jgi:hypothetical protein
MVPEDVRGAEPVTQAQAIAEARRLKPIVERWGVPCSIELQSGRGTDPWLVPPKYHRMHHHTASWYRGPTGPLTPLLSLVKTGRTDVIGPLCNGYGGYDGIYRIICMGEANHPGTGGPITIDGVYIPANSARKPTWGTEWEGGYQDYEDIDIPRYSGGMLEFMGRVDCALAEWSGRPLTSQMEHLTWAPDRKIDRREFTRARGITLSREWFATVNPTPIEEDDMQYFDFKIAGTNNYAAVIPDGTVVDKDSSGGPLGGGAEDIGAFRAVFVNKGANALQVDRVQSAIRAARA